MLLPLLGLIVGFFIIYITKFAIPLLYARYLAIAILAALDSVFGGIRAGMEGKFNNIIFVSGFFTNTLLAAILAYIGDQLGVDIYMAAIIVFGVRIFQNIALIRRLLLERYKER